MAAGQEVLRPVWLGLKATENKTDATLRLKGMHCYSQTAILTESEC